MGLPGPGLVRPGLHAAQRRHAGRSAARRRPDRAPGRARRRPGRADGADRRAGRLLLLARQPARPARPADTAGIPARAGRRGTGLAAAADRLVLTGYSARSNTTRSRPGPW